MVATTGLSEAKVVPGIGVAGSMLEAETKGFDRLGVAFLIPQQIGQAERRLGITGLIAQQQPQFPFGLLGLPHLKQRQGQVVAAFTEAGMHLKGFPVQAQPFCGVAEGAAGIAAVEQHKRGEKASGLGRLKTAQGQLVAAEPGMTEAFEVSHFTGMGVALQARGLIHHLLEALLHQCLIQMCQPRLRCVVLRPAARWRGDNWKRRLGQGLLSHG